MSTQESQDESIEERRQRLKDAAERKQKRNQADQWDPAAGEMLESEYIGSRTANTDYGAVEVYYFEELGTGDVYSIIGRTSMKMEMDSEAPDEGDLVMVTYEGRKESENYPSDFYSYDVVAE